MSVNKDTINKLLGYIVIDYKYVCNYNSYDITFLVINLNDGNNNNIRGGFEDGVRWWLQF